MKTIKAVFTVTLLLGCGTSPMSKVDVQHDYLTVIDPDGQQRVVLAEELDRGPEGEASQSRVLVTDRKTGKRSWITLQELRSEPPARARYIPVTP